jgi:hypothetical protein
MPILRIIILVLVVVAAAGGYFVYAKGAELPDSVTSQLSFLQGTASSSGKLQLPKQLPSQLASLKVPSLPENAGEQLQEVGTRTSEVGATVGKVLGTAVKEASPSAGSSLQERAFDYGRYLYCQQVVQDYEARTKN